MRTAAGGFLMKRTKRLSMADEPIEGRFYGNVSFQQHRDCCEDLAICQFQFWVAFWIALGAIASLLLTVWIFSGKPFHP